MNRDRRKIKCDLCNRTFWNEELNYVVDFSDPEDGLVPLCPDCHKKYKEKMDEVWKSLRYNPSSK